MTKFTEPIRLGATVLIVPKLSNILYAKKMERRERDGTMKGEGEEDSDDEPEAFKI
jgi:hypothetical protein